MSRRVFWLRTQRSGDKPPIEGQCQNVHPSGMRCGQALWKKDGRFCYGHAPKGKRKLRASSWSIYGTCPRCKAKRGNPCVTKNGIPTFKHVGRIPKPTQILTVAKHGPVQAQIVELGGETDNDGMVRIVLRAKPAEARKFGAILFEWVECTATTAKLEPRP